MMRRLARASAAFVAGSLALTATMAQAEVTTTAKVRYEADYGHSRWYEMQVHFLMGSELNEATTSYRYSPYSGYAVIFFAQDQAAVIKLRNIYCTDDFSVSCLPSFGNPKGQDQDGKEWEICTGSFC